MRGAPVPVITLTRQYGSLGDEVARDVAERLSLRLVDQDIINEVAERLGVPASSVTDRDERESSVVSELVRTMRRLYPATIAPSPEREEVDEGAYLQVIRQVIWEVVRGGHALIMGRGAPFVLQSHPEVLHVLVVAPLHIRAERVAATDGVDLEHAMERIREVDGNRGRYVRHYYRVNWLDAGHYDLVLNTGHFSQVLATELIVAAVRAPQP